MHDHFLNKDSNSGWTHFERPWKGLSFRSGRSVRSIKHEFRRSPPIFSPLSAAPQSFCGGKHLLSLLLFEYFFKCSMIVYSFRRILSTVCPGFSKIFFCPIFPPSAERSLLPSHSKNAPLSHPPGAPPCSLLPIRSRGNAARDPNACPPSFRMRDPLQNGSRASNRASGAVGLRGGEVGAWPCRSVGEGVTGK